MLTRSIGWMMAAALVVAVVACDHSDSGASGAAEADGTHTSSASRDAATAGEVDEVDVDEAIDEAHDAIEDAAGDFCATLQATGAPLAVTPGTVEEAEAAAELILSMLRHMGAVAGEDAPVYEKVAEDFEEDFDGADHSPEWLQSPAAFRSLDDPAFVAATARLRERAAQECRG